MAGIGMEVEHEFDGDIKPAFEHLSLIIIDNESSNEPNVRNATVDVFYPSPDSERTTWQEEDQKDPLAFAADWTQCKQTDINEELTALENFPQPIVSDSFSLVDSFKTVESNTECINVEENESEDIKPIVVECGESERKRKAQSNLDSSEIVPLKRINLGEKLNPPGVVVKELAVNIGPKLAEYFIPPKSKLKSSQTSENATSPVLTCPSCDFTCQDPETLKLHGKEHVILKIYTCSKCNHKCTKLDIHESHMSGCLSENCSSNVVLNHTIHNSTPRKGRFCCETCAFKFKNEQNLIIHENKHVLEKLFICYICEANFFTLDKLRDHFSTDHKSMEKIFPCNICQYSTTRSPHLKDHIIKHITDKHLYCYSCKKNYEDSADYNEHRLTIHKSAIRRRRNRQVAQETNEEEGTIIADNLTEDNKKLNQLKSSFEDSADHNKHRLIMHKKANRRKLNRQVAQKTNQKEDTIIANNLTEDNNKLNLLKSSFEDSANRNKHRLVTHKKAIRRKLNGQVAQKTNQKEDTIIAKNLTEDNNKLNLLKSSFEDSADRNKHRLITHKKAIRRNLNGQVVQKTNQKEDTIITNNLTEDDKKFNLLKSSFVSKTILISDFYHCNGCVYKFLRYEKLATHKLLHLDVLNPYKCRLCSFESLCAIEMKKHLLTHSGHVTTIECNVCKKLLTRRQMRKHAVFHIKDGLYCFPCSENYENTKDYEEHLRSKHQTAISKLSFCNQCSFNHTNYGVVMRHKKKYHCKREESDDIKTYDTDTEITQESISQQRDDLKNLNTSKHEKETNALTTKLRKVEVPLVEATQDNKNYNNSECGSKPSELSNFTCTFKCNKCSFQCSQIGMLQRHDSSVHAGLNHVFKCIVCDWQTCILNFYLKHTSHGIKRKYLCCYCQFESYKETHFDKHVKNHILKSCPYCEFKSKYFQNLKIHFSRQHKPGNEPFTCALCPYNTARKESLSSHCIMFHAQEFPSLRLPIPGNILNSATGGCGLCSFNSDNMSSLKRHVSRHYANGSLNKEKVQSKPVRKVPVFSSKEVFPVKERPNKVAASGGTEISRDTSTYYRCSKCPYISKHLSNVVRHLFCKHKIHGGVRNRMIVKSNGFPLQNNKTNIKKGNKTKKSQVTNKLVELNNGTEDTNFSLSEQIINDSEVNLSKGKSKSALTVGPLKRFACTFCPHRSKRAHDMKRHKARHLKGPGRRRKIRSRVRLGTHVINDDVGTPKQTVEKKPTRVRLGTHIINDDVGTPKQTVEKKPTRGRLGEHVMNDDVGTPKQTVEIRPTIIKNVYYSCSQCSFKNMQESFVTRHLLDIHNIYGDVTNHMVIKVFGTLPNSVDNNKTVLHNENESDLHNESVETASQSKSSKPNKLIRTKAVSTGLKVKKCREKCPKCSIHLLSRNAQTMHKSIGHRAFWNKPFCCTTPKCGTRFTSLWHLKRHLKENCKRKMDFAQNNIEEKKIDEVSPVTEEADRPDSDNEGFSCGECEYVTPDVGDLMQHMFIHSGIVDD